MNEIKTLLLCKIKPNKEGNDFKDYKEIYSSIYTPKKSYNGKEVSISDYNRYMTLGGFDALAVYSTTEGSSDKRLEAAWDDKKNIISNINEELSYHPIHLLREEENGQNENKKPKQPILLLCFVYGIIKNEEVFSSTSLVINEQGKFQKTETCGGNNGNDETIIEVYRCINISDRVLLIYTENIEKALTAIYYLEEDAWVRRTYTTVNFLLDGGDICSQCYDIIEKQGQLSIMIQGTIRNSGKWTERRGKLLGTEEKPGILRSSNPYEAVNFGEEDFLIAANITGAVLKKLLKDYLSNSIEYTKACWNIHTEIQMCRGAVKEEAGDKSKYNLNGRGQENFPDILSKQEKRYNEKFEKINPEWEWKYALKEVLSAQVSIDRHPMFKGPSYLLWDCFDIINDYLDQCKPNPSSTIPDINSDKIPGLISESGSNIVEFTRCISRLTDQLTRNDDIIFRGLGRVPAITATLPENLMEIYHAFLRELADALIGIDNTKYHPRSTPIYKYGFLIVPELNQRPQMIHLFNTETKYRKPIEEGIFYSWPSEQCHVIQLPLGDVYRPVQCLIPLVHECFHYFGDYYRSRAERTFYILECLATIYVDCVLYSEITPEFENNDNAKETRQKLINAARDFLAEAKIENDKSIYKAIQENLKKNTQSDIQYKLFLENLNQILDKGLYELLSETGTNKVYNSAKKNNANNIGFIYYPKSVESRHGDNRRYYWDANVAGHGVNEKLGYRVISNVLWLFKECYADFMMMEVLGVEPSEYLEAFNKDLGQLFPSGKEKYLDELASETERGHIYLFCQRIAVVLAAHYECNWTPNCAFNINNDINQYFLPVQSQGDSQESAQDILKRCFEALIYINNEESGQQLKSKDRIFPVGALYSIVWYLRKAQEKLEETKRDDSTINKQFNSLNEQFNLFFRKEQLFKKIKENGIEIDVDNLVEENQKRINNQK